MLFKALVLSFCYVAVNAVYYDSFTQEPLSEEHLATYDAAGITSDCAVDIVLPCDPNEWSRIDGSCNNLQNAAMGTFHTLQKKLLESEFDTTNSIGAEPRLTSSGKPYDPARALRSTVLATGVGQDDFFTQATAYFLEFMVNDIVSLHDVRNTLNNNTHCCDDTNPKDYFCAPHILPDDEPIHQFDDIRCLNMTRPQGFQNMGCSTDKTTFDRLDFTTAFWDLSNVYNYEDGVISKVRTFDSGLLKSEFVDDREFASDGNSSCTIQLAIDTGCARSVPNGIMGTNIFTTLFWRLHNKYARELKAMNPGWTDDRLFFTARDMNIATFNQMSFYELWVHLFGYDNMIEKGIITEDPGFSDQYDPDFLPQILLEAVYMFRYFHSIQEGIQEMYDENYNLVGQEHVVRYNLVVHDFAINRSLDTVVRSSTKQLSAGFDQLVDPDMGNKGHGKFQRSFDILSNDLSKGRYFGFPSYYKYLNYCTKKNYSSYEDLSDVMSAASIRVLESLYSFEDLELMPGVWSEKLVPGSHAPPTVACLIMEHLKNSVVYDRYWFERPNRPFAFTAAQLAEIRKSTFASFLCDVGEVSYIQPKAFLREGPGNYRVSCDNIPRINMSAWDYSSEPCTTE